MRLLGIDPGLRYTGWGVVDISGNALRHVANGTIKSTASKSLPERLQELFYGLEAVIMDHKPDGAAVEETFVNDNPRTTLSLGQARGIAILVPQLQGLPVAEYSANLVKKSVVGNGHASKEQIGVMVKMLLPGCQYHSEHAADALAVAICHAHHAQSQAHVTQAIAKQTGEAAS